MATFGSDTFTGSDGTALSSHTPDQGGGYTQCSSLDGSMVLSDANRLRLGAGTTNRRGFYLNTAPGSANQTVSYVARRVVSGLVREIWAAIRITTAGDAGYVGGYNQTSGQWEIKRITAAGSDTTIGSYSQTLTLDQDYSVVFAVSGTTLTLTIDGVERINVSDANVTDANRVGFWTFRTGQAGSNSNGLHIDNAVFQDDTGTLPSAPLGSMLLMGCGR